VLPARAGLILFHSDPIVRKSVRVARVFDEFSFVEHMDAEQVSA
jgi:hypothetical protein